MEGFISLLQLVRENYKRCDMWYVLMFVECSSLFDSQHVFTRLYHQNESSWNLLIHGYIKSREYQYCMDLFQNTGNSIHPSIYTLLVLLKVSARLKCLERGCEIHVLGASYERVQDPCWWLILKEAHCWIVKHEKLYGSGSRDIWYQSQLSRRVIGVSSQRKSRCSITQAASSPLVKGASAGPVEGGRRAEVVIHLTVTLNLR